MAILIRKNEYNVLIAHPAPDTEVPEGALYINDLQHYALTVMFEEAAAREDIEDRLEKIEARSGLYTQYEELVSHLKEDEKNA